MLIDRSLLFRLSVAQYHRLLEDKILDTSRQIELLEGILIENMPRNPIDNPVTQRFELLLPKTLPSGWVLTRSAPLPLFQHNPESEPQPDYALIPSLPSAEMIAGVVVEIVSDNPGLERIELGRIYARAGIPYYWVLDYAERLVEVFTQPSGPIDSPHYAKRDRYPVGASVPVILDGTSVGAIAVSDVMG